ncbi:hypothetical protein PAXRUDRAFT_13684 [Paxillus rubicundulus Ve08.2h10]|uniref:Unplaced genomic scaffold scaffold_544, whole genome shotgun sequence n=1 Tax=Paxillus rubicundulus Ve08.2h10 TaxID=930991 RepID=A0A0D0D4X2_9AGAM|nr:hypothetical protein PAXRUDRAFT_13684 [Paxillus rubicundulus Ve08.2h10]
MQWPSLSHSTRDDNTIPLPRCESKYSKIPSFSSRPTSTVSSTSSSPSSPPPPYEDIHFVTKPILSSHLSGLIGASSLLPLPEHFNNPTSPRPYRDGDLSRVCGSHGSIPLLREALNSLDTRMASLLDQRRELESHLEQAARSQSPVYRLPEELLSSIFVVGVCELGDEDPLLVSSLMLVCRFWRDVAINTPELWANICVSPHDSLDKARRRLARSKSVPLDITVNFSPRVENATGVMENIVRAMDLVRPALWRARSFRLSVPNRPQAHAALLRCKEDAPHLETLSICIFHSMQEGHYSSPYLPLFNGHTPRLRSCSFTSFNFGWDRRLLSGLRVLQLGGYWNGFSPSVDKLLDVLRGCPSLEELALRNMSDVDPDASIPLEQHCTTTVVKLPRLTKASFSYAGNMRIRMLLSQISFPALESLDFCYLDDLTPVLEHLRQQSLTSLPLRHLHIESSFFNEPKFVFLLKRLMSLTTLELIDVEDVSGFLLTVSFYFCPELQFHNQAMQNLSTPPAGHPWVCPKLECLNLDGCTTMEWSSLRSLVESRLSGKSSELPSASAAVSRGVSSASASAHIHALAAGRCNSQPVSTLHRLTLIDVTRCHQISKEMVQWLRMYVRDVRCEPAKGVWGESVVP